MISIPNIFNRNNVAWLSFSTWGLLKKSIVACEQKMVRFLGTCHNAMATLRPLEHNDELRHKKKEAELVGPYASMHA
jgi:hypothetical protein